MIQIPLNNIKVRPRDNQLFSFDGSNSRSFNSHLYLDVTANVKTFSGRERQDIESYMSWDDIPCLSSKGLDEWVGRLIKTPYHDIINYQWIANTALTFELQTSQVVECEPSDFPFSVIIKSINMQNIDQYQYLTFSSGRQRRVKKMHGTVSRFSGDVRLSIEEFKTFLDWYRCFLANGGGLFNASWLVHPEIGAWSGHWAEPWEASFDRGVWTLSVQLILVKNTNLDFLSTIPWIIEELIAESEEVLPLICEPVTTHLIAQTQEELISATNAKPPLCALVN